MASTETTAQTEFPITAMGIVAPIAGWLVPGLGHFVQKKWIRGALLMLSVLAMFFFGLAMEGKLYAANTGDILEMLGFVGDLGSGLLYFFAHAQGWGEGAVSHAMADYGTKFMIVAGLLNIISAVDAHQIAIGKKP